MSSKSTYTILCKKSNDLHEGLWSDLYVQELCNLIDQSSDTKKLRKSLKRSIKEIHAIREWSDKNSPKR